MLEDSVLKQRPARRCDVQASWISLLLVVLVLLIHRGVVYDQLGPHFAALAAANPEHYSWQFLGLPLLRSNLGTALLVLQQTPPVSQIVVSLIARWADNPTELSHGLLILQTALSLTSSLLLYGLIRMTMGWRWRAAAVSILFGTTSDLVFMEYDNLGHDFYEFLTMTIVLALVVTLWRAISRPSLTSWAGAGALAATAALTRSSYSYLDLALVTLILVAPLRPRGRYFLAYIVPVLLLHGGWSLKNLWVYDNLTWATSSWGGSNAVSGIKAGGHGDVFLADLLAHRDEHPEWFIDVVETNDLPLWVWEGFRRNMPSEVQARDLAIEQQFGLQTRVENSVSMRVISDHYYNAFEGFALRHPEVMWQRLRYGYKLYWFPIRYYATNFLGLIASEWHVEPSMTPWQLVSMRWQGQLPEPIVLRSGASPDHAESPIVPPVSGNLAIATWYLTLVTMHTTVPLVALWILVTCIRQRRLEPQHWFFLTVLVIYAYAAGLHNIVEFRENMRFRLSVEPLIWWLTVVGLVHVRTSVSYCLGPRASPDISDE